MEIMIDFLAIVTAVFIIISLIAKLFFTIKARRNESKLGSVKKEQLNESK